MVDASEKERLRAQRAAFDSRAERFPSASTGNWEAGSYGDSDTQVRLRKGRV